jgi:hypothetical protein
VVRITILPYGVYQDRPVRIDFGPPAGPFVCLTPAEWSGMLDEIDRVKRELTGKRLLCSLQGGHGCC